MKKRGLIPSQTRISVQDARTFNTAVGVAHENEEMRRIQLGVNRLADELDELKDAAKPTTPTEKNPVKDRINGGGGGGDIIGGDTTINVVNNGGGGKWALTVISSIGRIFREKWVQALRFVSGSTGGPSQPYFKVPVAFTIESETIANDLKGDPTHPATQASIEANAYVDFRKALSTLRGRKSVYKDDSSANGYESLHGQPAILQYFELINDEETPGNLKYYGTDDVGVRGYHDLVQVIEDYGVPAGTPDTLAYFNSDGDLTSNIITVDIDGNIDNATSLGIQNIYLQDAAGSFNMDLNYSALSTASLAFNIMRDKPTLEDGDSLYYDVATETWQVKNVSNYSSSLTGTENNTVRFNATGDLEGTSDWRITGSSNESSKQIFLRDGERLGFNDTTNTYTTYLRSHATPTASTEYYLPSADGTSGQVLSTDGTGNLNWVTTSGSNVSFETRTLTGNITVNKSDGWANYVQLTTNNSTARIVTFGTGFVAGDYFYFTIKKGTPGLIAFSIQSVSFNSTGGGVFALWYDGTNWNSIFPNQSSFDISNADTGIIYGYNNKIVNGAVVYGRGVLAHSGGCIGFGGSIDITGNLVNVVGFNITSTGNQNRLFGNNISNTGTNNSIIGHFTNGSGSYNNIVVDDSVNQNNKSYLKGLGQGVRFLHSGEFAVKIDNKNYSTTGHQSHLRSINFGGITTNDTQTEIFLNDSVSADRLIVPAKSNYAIKGRVSAVQSDFSDIKHWEVSCNLLRDGSNNTSLQGSTHISVLQESTGATTWDILLSADNVNESLKVEVIGQASQTIYWKGVFEIIDLMLP